MICVFYRKMNRTADAVDMLDRCLRLNSVYAPAFLLLAKVQSGSVVGRLLRHVTRLYPSNPDYLAVYAHWLRENRKYKLSQKCLHGNFCKDIQIRWGRHVIFNAVTATSTRIYITIVIYLISYYVISDRSLEAMEYFRQGLKLKSDHRNSFVGACRALRDQGQKRRLHQLIIRSGISIAVCVKKNQTITSLFLIFLIYVILFNVRNGKLV